MYKYSDVYMFQYNYEYLHEMCTTVIQLNELQMYIHSYISLSSKMVQCKKVLNGLQTIHNKPFAKVEIPKRLTRKQLII